MRDVDAALVPFLHSTDESERDCLLGELILEHASPNIRKALRRRLDFYVGWSGSNPDNPEAEDLYHEADKEILKRLRELQSDPDGKEIERFDEYVQRVTVNICHDYLRSKAPRRYHLMTAHTSNTQMEKFRARVLPAPEMVAVAEHVSNCDSCRLLFRETSQRIRNFAPVTVNLSPEFWFRDDHLEYEQMAGLVDGHAGGRRPKDNKHPSRNLRSVRRRPPQLQRIRAADRTRRSR